MALTIIHKHRLALKGYNFSVRPTEGNWPACRGPAIYTPTDGRQIGWCCRLLPETLLLISKPN